MTFPIFRAEARQMVAEVVSDPQDFAILTERLDQYSHYSPVFDVCYWTLSDIVKFARDNQREWE